MNRRSFLRSLGLGVAAVYLHLAPEKVSAVPVRWVTADQLMASGYFWVPYQPIYVRRASGLDLDDFRRLPLTSRRRLF